MRRNGLNLSLLTLGALCVGVQSGTTLASSHREAPLISQDPLVDHTDVYAFVSPDQSGTVTMIATFIPLQEPASGPNFWKFDDDALYEIKVDNNGDAREDMVFQFRFRTQIQNPDTFLYNTGPITSLTDDDWNVRQLMTVTMVKGGVSTIIGEELATPPVNVGPNSTPDYDELAADAIHNLANGIRVFAGQRDDPFFVDLGSTFDLLQLRAVTGAGTPIDTLAGFSVHAIAIQVPKSLLSKDGEVPTGADDPDAIIGVWSTTSRRTIKVLREDGSIRQSGPWRQVSRLSMPLVNEVVIPLADKDKFNRSLPIDDEQFLSYVTEPEVPTLLNLLFGVDVPPTPRNDLVSVFLTGVDGLNQPEGVEAAEMLRLNMGIAPTANPDRLGVIGGDLAGYPNGRRLIDDTVDISLRVVAGVLVEGYNKSPNNVLGDGIDANDLPFLSTFPYLAPPRSGYDTIHGLTAPE